MTTAAFSYRSRALSAASVALPIPLLAALGLSLPLPATVARLAARLVPFADHGDLAAGPQDDRAAGRIVAKPGEASLVRVRVRDASGHTRVLTVPRTAVRHHELVTAGGRVVVVSQTPGPSAPAAHTPAAKHQEPSAVAAGATPSAEPDVPAPPPASAPTPSPPAPAPAPTRQVVDNATTAVDNTVTTATNVVNNTVTTVTGAADNTVGGLLGGKKP